MGYMRDKTGRRLDAQSIGDLNPVYHLNVYETFFGSVVNGTQNIWVPGQTVTATTLTGAVTAGSTVLPVASVTGISAGVILVTDAGTANQQVHRVLSVAGNNVTLTGAITQAQASGATVAPLWTNESHLTLDSVGGTKAFGYFVAQAKDADGNFIITGANRTVVWLGDSWTAQSLIQFNTTLDDRLGATNVVDAGVPGNTLAAMLARFDTDVAPAAPHFVIIEFGVNDVYGSVTPQVMAGNVELVVAKVRALGAVPIVTGIVPLQVYPAQSAARQRELKALLLDGKTYPALSGSGADSRYLPASRYGTGALGVGQAALDKTTSGDFNTAFGIFALQNVTSGGNNTGVGLSALSANAAGSTNTAVGSSALAANSSSSNNTAVGVSALAASRTANNTAVGVYALLTQSTSGGDSTAVGFQAGRGVTTGDSQTLLGYGAGYDPNGVAANATTTAIGQTLVGKQTGQGSATQRNYITCLGYRTTADGAGAVAIGTDSGGAGAAALAANEIALGTALHSVKVLGRLRTAVGTTAQSGINVPHGAAPTAPVDGDIWTTTAGMFIRINGVTKTVTLS